MFAVRHDTVLDEQIAHLVFGEQRRDRSVEAPHPVPGHVQVDANHFTFAFTTIVGIVEPFSEVEVKRIDFNLGHVALGVLLLAKHAALDPPKVREGVGGNMQRQRLGGRVLRLLPNVVVALDDSFFNHFAQDDRAGDLVGAPLAAGGVVCAVPVAGVGALGLGRFGLGRLPGVFRVLARYAVNRSGAVFASNCNRQHRAPQRLFQRCRFFRRNLDLVAAVSGFAALHKAPERAGWVVPARHISAGVIHAELFGSGQIHCGRGQQRHERFKISRLT